ncbi:MAG: GDP-mannose 4,6-dehydratase [Acetobacteraceae bacterium]|nr:GDP-mannose 4,6-dehydratase [Acetobacteraceae bacterium]
MSPGRILVTGAGGFVGARLLPVLRRAFPRARLVAGSRRGEAPAGWDAGATMELADADGLAAALEAERPEGLIHLAAQANVPASFADPAGTWAVNALGTVNLVGAVMKAAPECRCLFVSTAEVYGLSFQAGQPLPEDAPLRPANPYAASKAAAEMAVAESALRGLRALRPRPFNQVGAGQTAAFVLPAFARQVARIEAGLQPPAMETGALDRWRDFLSVDDVCRAYALLLRHFDALPNGAPVNISSGNPRRVGDALAALVAMAGRPIEIHTDPGRLRPTDVERTVGDATRAREALGWQPEVPFEAVLSEVLEDWRARVRRDGEKA